MEYLKITQVLDKSKSYELMTFIGLIFIKIFSTYLWFFMYCSKMFSWNWLHAVTTSTSSFYRWRQVNAGNVSCDQLKKENKNKNKKQKQKAKTKNKNKTKTKFSLWLECRKIMYPWYRETRNNYFLKRLGMSIGWLAGCHMEDKKPILNVFCLCSLNGRDVSQTLPENNKTTWLFYFSSHQISLFQFWPLLHPICAWNKMCIFLRIGTRWCIFSS